MDDVKIKTESEEQAAEEISGENDIIESMPSAAGVDSELLKEMIEVGAMYGHKKTKTNPKFKSYIVANRNSIEIIDLEKTISAIDEAAEFLANQIKENKMVLLVATQPAAWEIMEIFAKKFNLPFVKNRWIGGLITNFKIVSNRLEYFKKIQADMESGAFEKYTKKERVMMNKDIARMKIIFGGLENLTKIPDALFVVDTALKGHTTAIREARRAKVPIAAIIDSDDNPEIIGYPIPANDHSKTSIGWIVNRIISKL